MDDDAREQFIGHDELHLASADHLGHLGVAGAADFGGDFLSGMVRIIERAVVAAKREGLIAEEHEEGCVAGAAREALSQISSKALGMSVGGKIGVARCGGDMAVALFFGVGLGHLDEICIGLAHRAI